MPEPASLNDSDTAAAFMLGAKYGGMLPHGEPYFAEHLLAVVARSQAEYACAANLIVADRRRSDAADKQLEADRRRPSGRRIHTLAEAQVLRDRAARALVEAAEAEAAAISAVGAPDLEAARAATAYIIDRRFDGDDWYELHDRAEAASKRARAITNDYFRGFYVRGRAAKAKQPRGGVVPLALFTQHDLGGDPVTRTTESGEAGTISSAVELLVRWRLGADERAARRPREAALEAVRGVRRGEQTSGLGQIAAAARRGDGDVFDELDWEYDEEDETLDHVALMAARVDAAFERFGAPIQPGTVEVVSDRCRLRGHVDFLSESTVWDLKVSERRPTSVDLLQIALYWLVLRDSTTVGVAPTHVGVINPRLGRVWLLEMTAMPSEVLAAVEAVALDHPGDFLARALPRPS